jgi:hypothetical protein
MTQHTPKLTTSPRCSHHQDKLRSLPGAQGVDRHLRGPHQRDNMASVQALGEPFKHVVCLLLQVRMLKNRPQDCLCPLARPPTVRVKGQYTPKVKQFYDSSHIIASLYA